MKLKFHVYGGGDPSVGIWPTEATIIIEDNFGESARGDCVKEWKEILHDHYDLGKCRHYEGVWTEEEYQKMIEEERKEMEEMSMHEVK